MTDRTVLLIGGRSFIGGHVCRVLLRRNYRVLLHSSSSSDFRNLCDLIPHPAIEPVVCRYDQPDELRAVTGRSRFLIYAGLPYSKQSIGWSARANQDLLQFQSTLKIIAASQIERSAFVSVSGTIGRVAGGVADETRFAADQPPAGWGHLSQKIALESLIAQHVNEGLNAVIVNPSMCVGEFDTKPSTGEFFRFFARAPFSLMPEALLNLVDVEDAALGAVLAMEQGEVGQRYILGGINTTMGALIRRIKHLEGKPMPRVAMPRQLAVPAAYCCEVLNLVARRPAPIVPLLGIELIEQGSQHLSSRKAERAFGFKAKDPWPAVDRSYRWYKENAIL